jgi:hypothetical protein
MIYLSTYNDTKRLRIRLHPIDCKICKRPTLNWHLALSDSYFIFSLIIQCHFLYLYKFSDHVLMRFFIPIFESIELRGLWPGYDTQLWIELCRVTAENVDQVLWIKSFAWLLYPVALLLFRIMIWWTVPH